MPWVRAAERTGYGSTHRRSAAAQLGRLRVELARPPDAAVSAWQPLLLREPAVRAAAISWMPGDLLLFLGADLTSRVIEWMTWGPSHVGIVAQHETGPLLVESTTLCPWPCVLQGVSVSGVQAHRLEERIATYPGKVQRISLAPAWRLAETESQLLSKMLFTHWIGRPYDLRGAILSGTRAFKWSRLMPYPDLGSQFCSELVAAVLMRLGRMPLSNPSAYNPGSLLRELRRCAIYTVPELIHG